MAEKKVVSKKRILKKSSIKSSKKMVKKIIKPLSRKALKAPSSKAVLKLVASLIKKPEKLVKLGKVSHYYNHLKVGIVKISATVHEGQKVRFKGATTDFLQAVKSMQINHVQVKKALKGKVIGLKVSKRVREGDLMYGA